MPPTQPAANRYKDWQRQNIIQFVNFHSIFNSVVINQAATPFWQCPCFRNTSHLIKLDISHSRIFIVSISFPAFSPSVNLVFCGCPKKIILVASQQIFFSRRGREKLPRLIEIVGDRREIMALGGRQSPANGNYLFDQPDEIRQHAMTNDIFPDNFSLVMTSVSLDYFRTVWTIFKFKIV